MGLQADTWHLKGFDKKKSQYHEKKKSCRFGKLIPFTNTLLDGCVCFSKHSQSIPLYLEFGVAITIKRKLAGLIYRFIILLVFIVAIVKNTVNFWISGFHDIHLCSGLFQESPYRLLLLLSCALSLSGWPQHSSQRNPVKPSSDQVILLSKLSNSFPSHVEWKPESQQGPTRPCLLPLSFI